MEKTRIHCRRWEVNITLTLANISTISIRVPFDRDQDPREYVASIRIDESLVGPYVNPDDLIEALSLFKLVWSRGEPTGAGLELARRIHGVVKEWLKQHVECVDEKDEKYG